MSFLVLLCIPCVEDESDDQKKFDRFIDYTNKVYMENVEESLDKDIKLGLYSRSMNSMVYGYSLGNLLQCARCGSGNHRI